LKRKLVATSDFNVRPIYGNVNVQEDLEMAQNENRGIFSFSETPIYGQP
jgi:hypothetical protein